MDNPHNMLLHHTSPKNNVSISQLMNQNLDVLYRSENIHVALLDTGSRDIVVSFTSAGGAAHERNLHEFKASLIAAGLSAVFVTDKKLRWFNHEESVEVFNLLEKTVSQYRNAGALGSSMGGSAALLFSNFSSHISRVLSFAPQFSIEPPFIDFDHRYNDIGNNIKHYWPNFAVTPIKSQCHILYGATEWRDLIHGAMFSAANFNPFYLKGAPHEVPAYIKGLEGQVLIKLIDQFFDFSRDLDSHFMRNFFEVTMLETPRLPLLETEEAIWREKIRTPLPLPSAPGGLECLSDEASADQSSIWQHARGATTAEDAQLALTGSIGADYSFHTDFETSPWWQADLMNICEVHEIVVYNRIDQIGFARLAAKLTIEISVDATSWDSVFQKRDDLIFGGADGRPLVWHPATAIGARWIRIRAMQPCYFHLNQIRIYGRPITS
jgi:hypothetical protein